MSIAAIVIGASTAHAQVSTPPSDLRDLLGFGYSLNEDVGYCSQQQTFERGHNDFAVDSPWQRLFESGEARASSVIHRAEGLFGDLSLDLDAGYDPKKPPVCSEGLVQLRRQESEAKLADAERLLDEVERNTSKGLRAGVFQLCSQTVSNIELRTAEPAGRVDLAISIAPDFQHEFQDYTARFEGKEIYVRLNGRLLMTPRVFGGMSDGMSISASAGWPYDAAMDAARGGCEKD